MEHRILFLQFWAVEFTFALLSAQYTSEVPKFSQVHAPVEDIEFFFCSLNEKCVQKYKKDAYKKNENHPRCCQMTLVGLKYAL